MQNPDEWFPNVRTELEAIFPTGTRGPVGGGFQKTATGKYRLKTILNAITALTPTFSTGVVRPETYDIQPQGYCRVTQPNATAWMR